MTEAYFKRFERMCADLIHGTRYPANTGGKIDVESQEWAGQCKIVAECSLEALTKMVEETQAVAAKKGKRGVLLIRVKRGRGVKAPTLAVLTSETWEVEE